MKPYDKNCKKCRGTGCVYTHAFDPPEECDCWDRFQPDDESSESNTMLTVSGGPGETL